MTEANYVTTKEIADHIRISQRQVQRLARRPNNPMPYVRIGRSVRFSIEAVDAWVESQAVVNIAKPMADKLLKKLQKPDARGMRHRGRNRSSRVSSSRA